MLSTSFFCFEPKSIKDELPPSLSIKSIFVALALDNPILWRLLVLSGLFSCKHLNTVSSGSNA